MMRTLSTIAIIASLLAVTSQASPTTSRDDFAGTTWHIVRIDADALFFVVKDVGIRFEQGGRFVAAVRFIDGQQTSKMGTYRIVRPGTIMLAIDGLGKPKS